MSIASEIQRISGCREDIKTAIAAKGVTVPATATLSSCPDLIASIQGGGSDALYTLNYDVTLTATQNIPFTAEQKVITTPGYEYFAEEVATGFSEQQGEFAAIPLPVSYLTGTGVSGYFFLSAYINGVNESENNVYLVQSDAYLGRDIQIGTVQGGDMVIDYDQLMRGWSVLSSWGYGNTVYISIESRWWQGTQWSMDSCIVSGRELTGTSTAYNYPDRPTYIASAFTNNFTGVENLGQDGNGIYANYSLQNSLRYGLLSNNFTGSESSNYGGNLVNKTVTDSQYIVNTFLASNRLLVDYVAPNTAYNFTLGAATTISGIDGNITG